MLDAFAGSYCRYQLLSFIQMFLIHIAKSGYCYHQSTECVAGNIPEDRFVEYFVESLKKEEDGQFDTTVEQFMECAKACREGKLAERKAADAEQAARLGQLTRDNAELQRQVLLLEQTMALTSSPRSPANKNQRANVDSDSDSSEEIDF